MSETESTGATTAAAWGAVAGVLRAMTQTPDDLNSILQIILDHAFQLCRTDKGFIYLRDGDVYRHTVDRGASAEVVAYNIAHPIRPSRSTSTGRAIIERKAVHIPDIFEDTEYEYWEAQELGGFRSLLSVPMLLDDEVAGVLSVYRDTPDPFDDADIELVSVFADQASLAFETSRLVATVERQRSELARYLPRQVADLVSSSDRGELLAGHRREISVVFCDLRGFTAFAAAAEPEDVIGVLAEYHEEMGRLIVEHEGTLSHFAGDGLMVYFNDPEPMEDHADRAITMARKMQRAFMPLAQGWRRLGHDLGLGIGIATGYATLGRIGFADRHHYGVIGSVVNLGSRLCDEALAGEILLSQRTVASARTAEDAESTTPRDLKGFAKPVPVLRIEPPTDPTAS
jgi:class 3 adenylate cyclase